MAKYKFTGIAISGMASAVPANVVDLTSRSADLGKATVDAFIEASGIRSLHLSNELQTTSDLGFIAAMKLLDHKKIDLSQVGLILFVSKTPDYRSPATAAVLHGRLGLSKDCIAFDINIGCAGFIYGLQAGCSILNGINRNYGLLVVGDTSSKQLLASDPLSMMFGDGAAAMLLEKRSGAKPILVETYADGTGFRNMINPDGGFRYHNLPEGADISIAGVVSTQDFLMVDDTKMEAFAVREIPDMIKAYLIRTGNTLDVYDLLAFNQVHQGVLSQIAEKLGIGHTSLIQNIAHRGYTCGNSIPLLISDLPSGHDKKMIRVLASGFGEGLSWGLADFELGTSDILPVIETDEYFTGGSVSHVF